MEKIELLISCAVTAHLICTLICFYICKMQFSHDKAHALLLVSAVLHSGVLLLTGLP